jgi:hypothetical protein
MWRDRADSLESLRWHWGSAYRIAYRRGQWTAERRDDGRVLEAGGPEQLLAMIREDYAKDPVPRDLPEG